MYLQAFILQWTNVNKALLDVKWNFSELLLSVAGDPKTAILIKLVLWHDWGGFWQGKTGVIF